MTDFRGAQCTNISMSVHKQLLYKYADWAAKWVGNCARHTYSGLLCSECEWVL